VTAIGERALELEVRPDIAGYADLAHAFDLHGSLLAAKATLDCAFERRETRGAHNRLDYPQQDPGLRMNLVWKPGAGVVREPIAPPSAAIAELAGGPEVEVAGRLLE